MHTNTYIHAYTHEASWGYRIIGIDGQRAAEVMRISVFVYVYVFMCVCVCMWYVCMCNVSQFVACKCMCIVYKCVMHILTCHALD